MKIRRLMEKLRQRLVFCDEFRTLFLLLLLIFCVSIYGQYSAFNGEWCRPFCDHLLRISFSFVLMLLIYLVDSKFWINYAYFFYLLIFCCLIIVEILGVVKLGAQRWINLYFFTLQPSELMKIALILALVRYYSDASQFELQILRTHFTPAILVLLPFLLILRQPDLGTSLILFFVGGGIIFLAEFPMRAFKIICTTGILLCPFSWFFLHSYQKNRILNFIDPDRDPLGTGYHILQSKIAIGSGGLWGKGFLNGTQSKLDFLPEKNTDFIFTTLTEELGFLGGIFIIFLLMSLVIYFLWAGMICKKSPAKMMCYGISLMLFFHTFINIAMVMGIVPIVGIPLPFISYGGTSMITFSICCGLIMSALRGKRGR